MASFQFTSSPRAGRLFVPTHELALHDDARAACTALPGSGRGVSVIQEMAGPIGIPDLTALVGNPAALQARLALHVAPILNQLDAAIVATTPTRSPRSSEAMARILGWPEQILARRLPRLVDHGAVTLMDADRYLRPPEIRPLGRIYAVEAKVSNRGAAIQQARAYSAWADSYVLVMGPLSPRPLEILLDGVDADKGGLMVNGRWLRRPVIRPLSPVRRLWAAEHFVAAMKNSSYQPSVEP
jgi:hypothetical protein